MAFLSAFCCFDPGDDAAGHALAMLQPSRGKRIVCRAGSFAVALDAANREHALASSSSAVLVADCRLTNRAQLAAELGLVDVEACSDSHLLLAAHTRWGERCVEHLLGAFAFAVWHAGSRTLFAARDHTGQRPLYYARQSGFVAICSTQQGLLQLPQIQRAFNEDKILDYFTYSTGAAGETYFRSICRLLPGNTLTMTSAGSTIRTYWNPLDACPTRMDRDDDYATTLTSLLDDSTRDCLPMRGATASHLTAGLDSASVTASAAMQLAHRGRSLYAFTAVPQPGFAGTRVPWGMPDEGPAAAEVAALYPNIEHGCVDTSGRNPMDDLSRLVEAAAEPVANAVNCVWMLAILERARRLGVDVLLTGQHGNATISYEGTLALGEMARRFAWPQWLVQSMRLRLRRELALREVLAISLDRRLPLFARRVLNPPFNAQGQPGMATLHPGLVRSRSLEARARDAWYSTPGSVEQERRRCSATVDLGNLYRALHTLTGVETRDPTADKRLYDFCYSIPVAQFLVGGRTRSLIRRAMRQRLPAATIERTTRGFQGADWHLTLRPAILQMRDELELIEQSSAARHYLNLPYLRHLVSSFPAHAPDTRQALERWNLDLTKGIVMGHFLRTHERARAVQPARHAESEVLFAGAESRKAA